MRIPSFTWLGGVVFVFMLGILSIFAVSFLWAVVFVVRQVLK